MTKLLCWCWIALVWLTFVEIPKIPELPRGPLLQPLRLQRSWGVLCCLCGLVLAVRVQIAIVPR